MNLLPRKGNRNSVLTLVAYGLVVVSWVFASAFDWPIEHFITLVGGLTGVKLSSTFRARGEYAYVEERDAPLEAE